MQTLRTIFFLFSVGAAIFPLLDFGSSLFCVFFLFDCFCERPHKKCCSCGFANTFSSSRLLVCEAKKRGCAFDSACFLRQEGGAKCRMLLLFVIHFFSFPLEGLSDTPTKVFSKQRDNQRLHISFSGRNHVFVRFQPCKRTPATSKAVEHKKR